MYCKGRSTNDRHQHIFVMVRFSFSFRLAEWPANFLVEGIAYSTSIHNVCFISPSSRNNIFYYPQTNHNWGANYDCCDFNTRSHYNTTNNNGYLYIKKLYIKLKEILFSFNIVGEHHEVKIYTWVHTLIYLSQSPIVKIDILLLMCKTVNSLPHYNGNNTSNLHNCYIFEWET